MSSEVKIVAKNEDGFEVINFARNHSWLADEPIEYGGNDSAAKPTELFLSSLASCILITMRMYANRKQWKLGATSIELRYEKQENKTIIYKKITIAGDLLELEKARLLDIANRCPVAKIVSNPVEFIQEQ